MPRKDRLSATRSAARPATARVNREGDIVFTSATSVQTPDDLQPDELHRKGEREVERGDTQLNLRVDKIKQRLLQVLAVLLRSLNHHPSLTHFHAVPCSVHQGSRKAKLRPILLSLVDTAITTSVLSALTTARCHDKQIQSTRCSTAQVQVLQIGSRQFLLSSIKHIAKVLQVHRVQLRVALQTRLITHIQ